MIYDRDNLSYATKFMNVTMARDNVSLWLFITHLNTNNKIPTEPVDPEFHCQANQISSTYLPLLHKINRINYEKHASMDID